MPSAELFLSQNLSSEAPLSHVYVNERVVMYDNPVDGEGVEGEADRVESRVEEEGADVTYYTPMDGGDVEQNGVNVQSRAVLEEAECDNMDRAEGALLQAFHGLG